MKTRTEVNKTISGRSWRLLASRRALPVLAIGAMVVITGGCNMGPKSGFGFTLPDGDAERGKETFVAMGCHHCHTVQGVDLPPIDGEREANVGLGGEVVRIKTYGELVTSIVNPSHRLAKGYASADIAVDGASKMVNYNDQMTVSQLIDLVAFLQSHYQLAEFEPTHYAPYY